MLVSWLYRRWFRCCFLMAVGFGVVVNVVFFVVVVVVVMLISVLLLAFAKIDNDDLSTAKWPLRKVLDQCQFGPTYESGSRTELPLPGRFTPPCSRRVSTMGFSIQSDPRWESEFSEKTLRI